jgi:hypothetical protein
MSKETRMLKRESRRVTRKLAKEARRFKKKRHSIALGIVLHDDHTMSTREIDLTDNPKEIIICSKNYNIPDVPYRLRGWWPFRARTWKRKLFSDEHSIIVWKDGYPESMDCASALKDAPHQNILPTSLGGLIGEGMMARSLMSMRSKNKMGMDRNTLLIIIGVVGILIVVFSKLMGMW